MTIKIEFPADRTDIALALGKALTAIGGATTLKPVRVTEEVVVLDEADLNAAHPAEYGKTEHMHMASDGGKTTAACTVEDLKTGASESLKFYGLYPATKRAVILESKAELDEARKDPDFVLVDLVRYDRAVAEWSEEGPFYMLHHGSESGEIVQTWEEAEAGIANGADSVTKEHYDRTMAKWQIPTPSEDVKVDEHGTPFNAEVCAKAASPFYGSGKKKGQWKKRQGVDEAVYDEWYASAKPEPEAKEPEHNPDLAANTFGAPTEAEAPSDMGSLMKWVAEQQTAGNITQQNVTDGFVALSLPMDALINTDAHDVPANCTAMYNYLKGLI